MKNVEKLKQQMDVYQYIEDLLLAVALVATLFAVALYRHFTVFALGSAGVSIVVCGMTYMVYRKKIQIARKKCSLEQKIEDQKRRDDAAREAEFAELEEIIRRYAC